MELFLELAQPDKDGISRWVFASEFTGDYESLKLGNGGSWCRVNSSLAKKYILDFDNEKTQGNSIDAIKLNGFKKDKMFNQNIRADIKNFYKSQKCVMLGVNGGSENTKIEIDHKDGRKNDPRVSDMETQKLEDFQPLCKAANDAKRNICSKCATTDKRWDAKNIKGNPYSFYEGDENFTLELRCKGCYQYDPVQYRKTCVRKISQDVSNDIMRRLYPEDY
jgi:hypothetical protein